MICEQELPLVINYKVMFPRDPIDRSMMKKFTGEAIKHNKKLSGRHRKRKGKTPQSDAAPSRSSIPAFVKTGLRGSVEQFKEAGEPLEFDAVSETSRKNSVDDSCSFLDIRTNTPDHQPEQEVDSATNDDVAHREDVSDVLFTFDRPESIPAEPSPNVEDLDGAIQTPNHMEESPDNPEECGHAIAGASSDLIRYISVGIDEDYVCEVCQGSQKTCDCSLRQLIKWKRETSVSEELIYPCYLFFPPFYFGGKGIKGVVVSDVRGKIRNMPRWSWKPEQELGLFHFAIEHHQRFSMAGWIPNPVPAGNGCAVFVDMLAGSGERGEFVEAPVKEVVPSPILPPGWRRVENVFGRIHYEHSASGLGMYRHPSGSVRVNQSTGYPIISFTADHGDRSGRRGRWILDESTRVPPPIYYH